MFHTNRYKKHQVALFLTFIFLAIQLFGFPQDSLTLNKAIQLGLENNFQVQIYEQQTEIAKLNNTWGTVGRFPSIQIGATNVNRYDDAPTQLEPDGRSQAFTNTVAPYIQANWLLFSGFGVKFGKDKLELLEGFSEGYAALVVENTIQAIILGYYRVLLEQEKLKILKTVKDLSGDRYNYEMARKELGSAVTFDVLQAKNSFYSDSTNFLLQELNVKNAYLNLNLLLGEPQQTKFIVVDSFQIETPDYNFEELNSKMLASNKTLQNQYINHEILKKDIRIQKSNIYPVIVLNAGTDYNGARYDNVISDPLRTNSFDYYANFTLSFNLFNGGNTRAAIKSAQISEKIGQIETTQLSQTLGNYLANQYDLYYIRKQLHKVAEINIESASLNLEISTEKYRNGTINSFNYRDVQLIFLNASSNKLNAIYDLIDSRVELLRLTGGIVTEY
jgi:outer membrane protein TolC